MNDRQGRTIHDGDQVRFQRSGPAYVGKVVDADSHRALELRAVMVDFGQAAGHPQFINGEDLTVVEEGD